MRASASTDWTRKIDAAPSSVPIAPPLPPARDVPPRATAAMATSVYEVLELESAVRTSATSTRPAIPANTPPMVKATTRTAAKFTPDAKAVASLPPTEYRLRRYAVSPSSPHSTRGIARLIRGPGTGQIELGRAHV